MDGRPSPVRWVTTLVVALIGVVGVGAGLAVGLAAGDDDGGDTVAPTGQAGSSLVDASSLRQPIHEHADFALVIRGQLFDFGQPQFLSTEERELNPNVHIHDPRHTVIHVHREGTTWDEFFRSLGFELNDVSLLGEAGNDSLALPSGEVLKATGGETLKFIVNGVPVDGIAGMNIGALDRVLISFGPESREDVIATQWPLVTDQACIPQGLCSERGSGAGEHGEPCDSRQASCVGN
ncbi:MAG: hypothetical protein IT303_08775 [Dehalococcoidia bacterium]|nr:hypothetical protein [Dehalococcoidia bacterium]